MFFEGRKLWWEPCVLRRFSQGFASIRKRTEFLFYQYNTGLFRTKVKPYCSHLHHITNPHSHLSHFRYSLKSCTQDLSVCLFVTTGLIEVCWQPRDCIGLHSVRKTLVYPDLSRLEVVELTPRGQELQKQHPNIKLRHGYIYTTKS